MKKGKLKSLLREAFIAGGRYYIKPHIKENIGKTEGFDSWYMNNASERADMQEPLKSNEPKALIIDGVTRRAERNVEKQEKLVSALYRFSEGVQENPHDCSYGENSSKSIHLKSVGKALEDIMRIFGYDVTPLQ